MLNKDTGNKVITGNMENTRIKLIATDLDGTLLDSNKKVPAGFDEWVVKHKEIKMVIASGRQYYNICKLFPEIWDKLFIMADNGGLVFAGRELVYINQMQEEDVIYCIEQFSKREKLSIILSGEKSAYMEHSSGEAERNAHMYYEKLEFVSGLSECIKKDRIIKIAVFIEGHKAEERYKKLGNFHSRLQAVLSGDCWIDISDKSVNKGTAIRGLQDKYGIKPYECMAFGDYLNDIGMLLQCGESYAMENAHPSLKKIAKHAAPSNDKGGVMEVMCTAINTGKI